MVKMITRFLKKFAKVIYILLGIIAVMLAFIGVFLPVLPTVPFLLLASFCFARGSEKINKYFANTKLYKNHLESFEKSKAMTLKSKLWILIPASTMLIVTAVFSNSLPIRILIAVVMSFKYYYFFAKIKTISVKEKEES